jgi:peroxiredoxin
MAKDFKEFRFIGIHSNTDEPVQESRDHFQQANLPFPIIQDEHAQLADLLGAFKTPHVFLLGKDGEILFQGGVDNSHDPARATQPYLKNALLALRSGKTVEVAQARALGCIIKR